MPTQNSSAKNKSLPKKLVLLDGNSLLYRGFFAMRALTTSAGQPTNAVFSFTMMLLTLLEKEKPDVMLCAWDTSKPTFRHELTRDYKGTRSAPPSELTQQGPLAREMVNAFSVPTIEAPGFEADDIIGTLAKTGREQGYEVLIVTGDLDALQLIEPGVEVMTTVKGVTDTVVYDDAAVQARYGLRPDQLADFRALKGDTSDNIPGVPGIGDKTAATLLQKYDTVENLLYKIDEVTPSRTQAALIEATEQIGLSKKLAVIIRDVPLPGVSLPDLADAHHAPDYAAVRALFERLEFRTLLKRIPGSADAGRVNTAGVLVSDAAPAPPAAANPAVSVDIEADDYDPFADDAPGAILPAPTPTPDAPPADFRDITAETDAKTFAEMEAAVRAAPRVAVRFHLSDMSGDILETTLLGVALAIGGGTVYHISPPEKAAGLLADPRIAKVTHDAKREIAAATHHNLTIAGIAFDTELAAYLLNAGRRSGYPLNEVAADYAGREVSVLEKKDRKTMEKADADNNTNLLAARDKTQVMQETEAILAVMGVQEPRLAADKLTSVLETLELPVAPILAEMELAGLLVDVPAMDRMAKEMQGNIEGLEEKIFAISGEPFSVGSTKQLQEVLFDKLKIPAGKKTKTGYSTGAEVLEELAPDYPIVSLILKHREFTKLKNTYAEAMPLLVKSDGRIHTSLNQTVAATGRLSSSNPNLQNIPVRTPIGREIRRAFIAAPQTVLVSADYSQIELRLFAHVTSDKELVAAFESGEDIHTYTGAKMYNVAVADVTTDMRRAAKTVNYAVIYGISEFALARRLGISFTEAKELKTSYFDRFPGVRTYLDETVAFARAHGYVQTLWGRRRYIPDISSRVFQFRQAAERAAANMPIQGSSADIMKLAMISVSDMLKTEGFASKMLLQVHDELLFETPPDEVNRLAVRVRECMASVYPLRVSLDVEVKTGETWADVTPVADASEEMVSLMSGA